MNLAGNTSEKDPRQAAMDYRSFLVRELESRSSRNPNYSLRSFARDLEVSPAFLSKVLSGKQNLSLSSARLVSEKICKGERAKNYFCALVELATARKSNNQVLALKNVQKYTAPRSETLDLDRMQLISDWYHIAILEMTYDADFDPDPAVIADDLGITVTQARASIESLLKLGLLVKEGNTLKKTDEVLNTPSGTPSWAIRRFHSQMILKAHQSIENQTVEERILSSKTMAINRAQLKKLNALISNFMDQVSREVAVTTIEKDALYQLNVQAFSLRKPRKTK